MTPWYDFPTSISKEVIFSSNLLLCISSSAVDITAFEAHASDTGATWSPIDFDEGQSAALPLDADDNDTYAAGVTINYTQSA